MRVQMYKKYRIFAAKIKIYNMNIRLKDYPITFLVLIAIFYLSFFTPPETQLSEVPFIDKWTHICMYGGLVSIIWMEYLRKHSCIAKQVIWICLVFPTILGGIIELMQAYCTTTRSGDWLDFLANTLGVILGNLLGYYVQRPFWWKKNK
mgnify:FL=1